MKLLKRILLFLLVMVVLFAAGAWYLFGGFIRAAQTVTKQEEHLYSIEYEGDYGFDEFLEKGGADSDAAVADYLVSYLSRGFYHAETEAETEKFGCSTICLKDGNGDIMFGRNYDWQECDAMIVHTKPKNGYESLSTCCLDFLGFGENYQPDESMMNRIMALAAIYVPLDGMNEAGLMVADLIAGDNESTSQTTEKTDLTTTTAIRLLLDHAANVEEAIDLLQQYDMHSSIGSAHHLSIADASGRSIVVEYVNGEMLVKDTKVVTNHYLTDTVKQGTGSEQSHKRYDTLMSYEGTADQTQLRDILKSVAQFNYPQTEGSYEKTMWSIVYDPTGLCADFYFNENYEYSYGLLLREKGSFIKK